MYQSVGTNVAVYIAQALDLPLFRKLNSNYIISIRIKIFLISILCVENFKVNQKY